MTTNVLVFGFGGILILVAILGGGFEIKEFKVPKVGWAPRIVAGIVGLFFILWGVGIGASGTQETQEVKASIQERPGEFTIYDNFGDQEEGRVSEQVTVLIDGKIKGQLTADRDNTQAMLTITVPQPGRYSYTVDATRVVDVGGNLYRYPGAGQGTINVEYGKKFSLVESITGDTWLIAIMEQSELEKSK